MVRCKYIPITGRGTPYREQPRIFMMTVRTFILATLATAGLAKLRDRGRPYLPHPSAVP